MVTYVSIIALAIALSLLGISSFAAYFFTPPRKFPRNIPTIPFYYVLLPLFKDVDQAQLYRIYLKEPLEQYGAVKIFFGGRWNILVRRPLYIAEVFKYEDIYAKAGNQIKIPHSVIAEYTGENIISAHGETWKLFTTVMKPALQRDHDSSKFWHNARLLKAMFVGDTKNPASAVAVGEPALRLALANLSEVLYESSFGIMQNPDAPLHCLQKQIKPRIFNPIFLNFPFLDRFPIKSRQVAQQLVRTFRSLLVNQIITGHKHECTSDSNNLACRLLDAHQKGRLTEKHLYDNILIVLIAGHENPQLALVSLMFCLGQHPEEQEKLRHEIKTFLAAKEPDNEPAYSDIRDLPLLTAAIYESLRLFPSISQLINRRTTTTVTLGNNVVIPEGTYVGYNCYSTNRDTQFWGPDADEFKPSRWGTTTGDIQQLYRKANAKGAFITFHGGRRACLGQRFAMQQLRITMVELLKDLSWVVDKSWDGRMTPAGPLSPRNLKLVFERLGEEDVTEKK